MIGDDAPQPGMTAVSVGDRTVKGGVGGVFAIVTTIELWAVPGVVRGIGYFAMKTLGSSGGAWGGSSGFRADVGLSSVRLYPSGDIRVFFPREPGHGVVEVRDTVA